MALRQQVWVDRRVQGVLVGRVILYWICALLYVGIGSACFQYNQNPEWSLAKQAQVLFGQMWPWLPTAILILPLAVYDVVRLSNLFAGPVFRLRKHFAALREDIACAPLTFRDEDYWRDLATPINDMQAEILRLRTGIIELQKVRSRPFESTSNSNTDATRNVEVTKTPADEDVIEMRVSSSGLEQELNQSDTLAISEETVHPVSHPTPAAIIGEHLATPMVLPAN